MIKLYFCLITLFVMFFVVGCSNISTIQKTINTSPENLNEIIKEMVIKENHDIESEDGLNFTTKWRRAYQEEDNHPDNTVEVRIEVSIVPEKSKSSFSMKLEKRSSLYSTDPSNITYSDIGIIQNDKLYMKWNNKIKDLIKEFEKNR